MSGAEWWYYLPSLFSLAPAGSRVRHPDYDVGSNRVRGVCGRTDGEPLDGLSHFGNPNGVELLYNTDIGALVGKLPRRHECKNDEGWVNVVGGNREGAYPIPS